MSLLEQQIDRQVPLPQAYGGACVDPGVTRLDTRT